MNFYHYWRGLTKLDKTIFAIHANRSEQYIETHLIHRRKKPSIETMTLLANASQGVISYDDLFAFFYLDDHAKTAYSRLQTMETCHD